MIDDITDDYAPPVDVAATRWAGRIAVAVVAVIYIGVLLL